MNNNPTAPIAQTDPTQDQPAPAPFTPLPSAAATAPTQPIPVPGWRTTEFWMTAASHVGLLLAASAGALPPQYAAIAIAASQVAYNLSRGMAKQNIASAALLAAH